MSRLLTIGEFGEDILACPECQDENLHQKDVEVWNRREDSVTGHYVKVWFNGGLLSDTDVSKNPSPRRQGLSITFECEQCYFDAVDGGEQNGKTFILDIIRYKGGTTIRWRDRG